MPSRAYDGEWIITSMLADRAERFGDQVAVSTPEESLTYADMVKRGGQIAALLAEIGIEPGDRVATMLSSDQDYVAAWHGTIWRGAIEVPINVEYRGVFLEHILRDSGASAIVVDSRWIPRLCEIDLADVKHLIVKGEIESQTPDGLAVSPMQEAFSMQPLDRYASEGTDPTYIMYTSGTTGPSKGAVHNNISSCHYIMPFVQGLDLRDDDVCYSMFPLFHQMGRSACTTAAFWVGNRVEMRPRFSASGFWDDIRGCGATWMGYFGAVVLFLWQAEPSPGDRDHRLRRAFGSSAPPELIPKFEERFGVTLHETYGSTEIGNAAGPSPRKLGTAGGLQKHVELAIVDQNDEPVPQGEVGEAVWRPRFPYAIFQGYWNQPQATVDAWRNLWFHSGDAAYLDEDGFFVFRDRLKDVIRRRGENISSFDVESAVRQQPGVVECAAYAVHPLIETDDEVMVAVVAEQGEQPDVEELFKNLCLTLPRSAVPRFLRLMDELPKTPTQRLQKFKLRDEGITDDSYDREAMGIFPPRD